jgi:transcriptional regulator NrdR family protein
MKHVVKSNGRTETFNNQKLYASIYASCLSVRESATGAELVAQKVTKEVESWLFTKNEVTANDVRRIAGKYLSNVNPHAGYLYLHHRLIW